MKSQHIQLEAWMQWHSDKCSTQLDSTASLLSAACNNYELLSIIMWHARFS